MFFCIFVSFFLGFVLTSQSTDYPVKVSELGDIVIQGPLIAEAPNEAEMHVAPVQRLHRLSPRIVSHPMYPIDSFEYIASSVREGALDFDSYIPEYIRYIICKQADAIDAYNASILNGDRSLKRVAIFAAYFFKIFKQSFPGLLQVIIEPLDIFYLTTISYSIGIGRMEESMHEISLDLHQFWWSFLASQM